MTGKDLAILSKLRQGFKAKRQKEKAGWLEDMRQALNPEEKKVFSLMESFYKRYKEQYKETPQGLSWFDLRVGDIRRTRIWKQLLTIHRILTRLEIDQEDYLGFLFNNREIYHPKIYYLNSIAYTGPYLYYRKKDGTLFGDELYNYWEKIVADCIAGNHLKTKAELFQKWPRFVVDILPKSYLKKDKTFYTLFQTGAVAKKLPGIPANFLEI